MSVFMDPIPRALPITPRVTGLEQVLFPFLDAAFAFAQEAAGLQDIRQAWDAFRAWQETPVDTAADDWRLFISWYVFHWRNGLTPKTAIPLNPSIAERFLLEHAECQTPEIVNLVRNATNSPLDFYETHEFPDLGCYYLKSLFLGLPHSFTFQELPPGISVGDIFFGQIVQLHDDRGIIVGRSRVFSVGAKIFIARMRRRQIKKRAPDYVENFWLFDSDVFNLYQDLRQGGF